MLRVRIHAGGLVGLLSGALVVAAPLFAGRARADAGAVDAATRARAAKRFRQGERFFESSRYAAAARAFEQALAIAPHPAALFNAAVAWEKAGELVRAANLCARYLENAPSDDRRQSKARALLARLTPKLGRIEVDPGSGRNSEIDGHAVEREVTFVDPGDHSVTAEFDGEVVERKVEVVVGSVVRVKLEPGPAVELEETPPERDEEAPEQKRGGEEPSGLAPGWFWAGAAITGVVAGATVWSGLDTSSARAEYDDNPTRRGLDEGRGKQRRTNYLLGATLVAGVGTGLVGALFTDWGAGGGPGADEEVGLTVGPGYVRAAGRF